MADLIGTWDLEGLHLSRLIIQLTGMAALIVQHHNDQPDCMKGNAKIGKELIDRVIFDTPLGYVDFGLVIAALYTPHEQENGVLNCQYNVKN